eukprot:9155-Chlamydomonas_euryale.AAC.1
MGPGACAWAQACAWVQAWLTSVGAVCPGFEGALSAEASTTFARMRPCCSSLPFRPQFEGALSAEAREKDRLEEQKVIEARIREREV